jgi:hypothetical protein
LPLYSLVDLDFSTEDLVFERDKLQTKQGCQTEAADYLVDLIWAEFGPVTPEKRSGIMYDV